MKSLYAKYGDTLYKLDEYPRNNFKLANITEGTHLYYSEPAKEAVVDLSLGIIGEDFQTNKAATENVLRELEEKKITNVETLIPEFEIALDYVILDEDTHKVYDEGVMIRHIMNPEEQNRYRILGVTEEEEVYARLVKELKTNFNFKYHESYPCGIMKKPSPKFVVIIHNITIHQRKDYERYKYEGEYVVDEHKCSDGVALTRETFATRYRKPEDVVIFDAVQEGMKFEPIIVDKKFRTISISLSLILNDYIIVYDDKTINDILEKNKEVEETPSE